MADDVIREPHSVRRATGPLFGQPTPEAVIQKGGQWTAADELLAGINARNVHLLSDAELRTLFDMAAVAPRPHRVLSDALRYEMVARILSRHGDLRDDEASA